MHPDPEPTYNRAEPAQEVAEAMAYLHSKGIAHADLTATSVLLVPTPVRPRVHLACWRDVMLHLDAEEGWKGWKCSLLRGDLVSAEPLSEASATSSRRVTSV